MTVDLCTKSCKEIGQPLAAVNYGTVSHFLGSIVCNDSRPVFMRSQLEWRRPTIVALLRSTLRRKQCSAMRGMARSI
jgi:hypothetical protein